MERLSKDVLYYILDKLSFPDISNLSQTCKIIHTKVMNFKSMANGREYLYKRDLHQKHILINAAKQGDLKLVKHLVEYKYKYKYGDEWEKACENCKSENVIRYLNKMFGSIKINDLNINIKRINLKTVRVNNYNIIGPRILTQKFVKDILYSKNIDRVLILSLYDTHWITEIVGGDKCNVITDDFNTNLIDFWECQKYSVRNNRKNFRKNRALIIIDQILLPSKNMLEILSNNRKYHTTIINMSSSPSLNESISSYFYESSIRLLFDYVIMFREFDIFKKNKFYSDYCNRILLHQHFLLVFKVLTQNNRCFIVNQNSNMKKYEDFIHWYDVKDNSVKEVNVKENKRLKLI